MSDMSDFNFDPMLPAEWNDDRSHIDEQTGIHTLHGVLQFFDQKVDEAVMKIREEVAWSELSPEARELRELLAKKDVKPIDVKPHAPPARHQTVVMSPGESSRILVGKGVFYGLSVPYAGNQLLELFDIAGGNNSTEGAIPFFSYSPTVNSLAQPVWFDRGIQFRYGVRLTSDPGSSAPVNVSFYFRMDEDEL